MVSGDIIKAYYTIKGQNEKTALAASILIDRMMGMYTMFLAAAFVMIYFLIYSTFLDNTAVWSHPHLMALGSYIIFTSFILSLLGLLLMNRKVRNSKIINTFLLRKRFLRFITLFVYI